MSRIPQLLASKDMRLFTLYFRKRNFAKAITAGSDLEKKNQHPAFIKDYGLCHLYSGNAEEGSRLVFKALETIESFNYDKLLACSKQALAPATIVRTEYACLGGYGNYGFIRNDMTAPDQREKSAITKVTWHPAKQTNYERYYYQEVCKKHPKLLSISPSFYDYQILADSGIELLTTEYVPCDPSAEKKIEEIIRINTIIESVGYRDAKVLMQGIKVKNKRYIPLFLHQGSINHEAILQMKLIARNKGELRNLVERIEGLILGKKLYERIRPEIHYAFCHNDFHRKNIVVQKNTGQHLILDWDNYGLAMRGWDMNFFFGNFQYTFQQIKELYLATLSYDDPADEAIAKIYFAFLQFYLWTLRLSKHSLSDKVASHFIPAVEYMESVCADLMEVLKESKI
jgi:hypothetical protein